jgi:hypothetical protein
LGERWVSVGSCCLKCTRAPSPPPYPRLRVEVRQISTHTQPTPACTRVTRAPARTCRSQIAPGNRSHCGPASGTQRTYWRSAVQAPAAVASSCGACAHARARHTYTHNHNHKHNHKHNHTHTATRRKAVTKVCQIALGCPHAATPSSAPTLHHPHLPPYTPNLHTTSPRTHTSQTSREREAYAERYCVTARCRKDRLGAKDALSPAASDSMIISRRMAWHRALLHTHTHTHTHTGSRQIREGWGPQSTGAKHGGVTLASAQHGAGVTLASAQHGASRMWGPRAHQ